jgi:hypothetical protein
MMTPLILNDFPMVGPNGDRDNVARLYVLLDALLPRHLMTVIEVTHEEGCPCSGSSLDACTCHLVDVRVRPHDTRRS